MTEKEVEIHCIGNALVDVFASMEEQTALRYGLTQPVQHVEIERLREILNLCERNAAYPKEKASPTVISSGGGAANVAKIAGFLGAKVSFTGALGLSGAGEYGEPDEFGRLFEKELRAAGVKLQLPLKPSPTGICLYLKTREGRRVFASPSAALKLSESDISEEDIRKAKLVLIDGFMMARPALVSHILNLTDKHGTAAALDLSSEEIAREHAVKIADYARQYPLILFMNEAEAAAFYEGMGSRVTSPWEVRGVGSREWGVGKAFPIIVVKLGSRGAVVFAKGTRHRVETEAVVPIDTTGAGDAFCAGFLTAWLRGKTLPECAAFGNRAARIILNVTGTKVDGEAFRELVVIN